LKLLKAQQLACTAASPCLVTRTPPRFHPWTSQQTDRGEGRGGGSGRPRGAVRVVGRAAGQGQPLASRCLLRLAEALSRPGPKPRAAASAGDTPAAFALMATVSLRAPVEGNCGGSTTKQPKLIFVGEQSPTALALTTATGGPSARGRRWPWLDPGCHCGTCPTSRELAASATSWESVSQARGRGWNSEGRQRLFPSHFCEA
jgi:hypothetical protein